MTDVNGKLLIFDRINGQNWTISTSDWANGIYIVTLENERGMKSLKLIK
jgi:hypothetical protein